MGQLLQRAVGQVGIHHLARVAQMQRTAYVRQVGTHHLAQMAQVPNLAHVGQIVGQMLRQNLAQ